MSIEIDIRNRLRRKMSEYIMSPLAKDEVLAIFDDMLHAHEVITEGLQSEIDELTRIEAALRRGDKP